MSKRVVRNLRDKLRAPKNIRNRMLLSEHAVRRCHLGFRCRRRSLPSVRALIVVLPALVVVLSVSSLGACMPDSCENRDYDSYSCEGSFLVLDRGNGCKERRETLSRRNCADTGQE